MAQKRLNKTLVIAVSLAMFALILLCSVLMLNQLQQRDPKYFVELAERAAKESQWRQAALFYGQALERSRDEAYLVPIGEMLLNDGEVGQAREAWSRALVAKPNLLAAHEKRVGLLLEMAELYGSTGQWDALREAAQAMLDAPADRTADQEAFARHSLGLALTHLAIRDQKNAARGIEELQKAADLAPQIAQYSIDVAAGHARQGRPDDAEKAYAALVQRYTEHGGSGAAARRAYAEHLTRRQKLDDAERLYSESIQFAQGDAEALYESKIAYAGFLLQRWALAKIDGLDSAQGYLDQSEKLLKEMVQEDPENFKPYLQLALLYKASSRFDEVVNITEQRLRQGLTRKGVAAAQNRVNAFTLMIYASEASVAMALQAGKTGDVEGKDKWLAKAEQYVVDARGEAPQHPRISSQAGRVKLARGQDRAGLEELRSADESYRSFGAINWENKLILADAHLRLNEAGAARAVLEEVVNEAARERPRDPLFWNLYAQSLFRSDELDRALAIADRVLMFDAGNRDATTIKAAIYERQGKTVQAGQTIEQLADSKGMSAMLRARAASLEGNSDEALTILKEALKQEPANVQLVGMAVNELVNRKRHKEAEQIVGEALKAKPDDKGLAQLAIYAQADLSDADRDRAMLEVIRSETDAYKRALDLVMFYSRKSDLGPTLQAVNEALQHVRDRDTPLARGTAASQHAALLKTKIRVAGQLKDEAALAEARDEAAKFNVDGAGGKSILGLYHMQRSEHDLAVSALREAVAQQPSDALSLTMLGQCYHAQGRNEEAKAAYERAVTASRELGLAHQGLAALAKARGDEAAFEAELALCERLSPDDPWVKEQLLIRTEEDDPQGAIAKRETVERQTPDDPYNLQRLASLYEKAGDQAKADAKYARIRELKPDDVRAVYMSATYLRRTGRADQGVELLTRFTEAQPAGVGRDQAARLLASEYREQGKLDAAEKTLLAAAGDSPSIEMQRAIAEFYLRAAEQPKKAVEWYDKAVTEAERTQVAIVPTLIEARIVARLHRGNNDFSGAAADVEILQARFPDFARGSLWESEIFARRGEIDQAVDSLSAYLSDRPDDTYALYQRARHHVARGSVALAVADLEAIKRINASALQYEPRLLLARLYRRTNRLDLWTRELEAIAAESSSTSTATQELADAYISLKRFDDADRLVTAQLNRVAPDSKAAWYFLRGKISTELGQNAKAIRDFEQGAEADGYSPSSVARVLAMYASSRSFEPGVAYFEKIRSKVTPAAVVASRYAVLLGRSGRTDEAVEQFRQAMALAIKNDPEASRTVADDLQSAFPAEQATALFQKPPSDPSLARANDRLLVRLYAVAKEYDKAVLLLDALIASADVDAHRAGLLHEKGTVLQMAARYDEAIEAYERSLEYDRNNWITLNNLAYVLSDNKGENERALPFAQRAVALADNSFTLDTLGWIYAGMGQFAQATAELSRAIRLDPDYGWAYYHLGEAHRRAGQFREAMDVLKTGRDVAATAGDQSLIQQVDQAIEKAKNDDSSD